MNSSIVIFQLDTLTPVKRPALGHPVSLYSAIKFPFFTPVGSSSFEQKNSTQ